MSTDTVAAVSELSLIISEAKTTADPFERLTLLHQVYEEVFQQDPSLLKEFYPKLVSFAQDSSVPIKLFVISVISQVCKELPHCTKKTSFEL
jgi:hypothetical protein